MNLLSLITKALQKNKLLAVLICMLAQRSIFPAHSISNKPKSLEVFLQCTHG